MSLQDVERKVLASAETEARQIVEQAEAEARAELERKGDELRAEQRRHIAAGKAEADAALERELSTRRAEGTLKILQAKNEALRAVFDQARERILRAQGFDYGAWLAKQVRRAVANGSGVLHCNTRDRVTVEAVLRETGTDQVTFDPQPAPLGGGVLLTGESFDLDLTLEAEITDLREECLVSLAERFFADVPTVADIGSILGA